MKIMSVNLFYFGLLCNLCPLRISASFLRGQQQEIDSRLLQVQPVPPREGGSVMCVGDEVNVYNWPEGLEGPLRLYPNVAVAESWYQNWREQITLLDCSEYEYGAPVTYRYLTEEDTSIMCSGDVSRVYRWTENNILRWYPDPSIAYSWNISWQGNTIDVDCKYFTFGDPMPMKS